MNILFVTYDIPWPLDAGGKIRAYNMLRMLSEHHQLTLITYYRYEEQLKRLNAISPLCSRIVTVRRRNVWNPFTAAYLLSLPFPAALYASISSRQAVASELQHRRYDLVHLESFYTSHLINTIRGVPIVLGTENIEAEVYRQYVDARALPPYVLPFANYEIKRLRAYEKKTWKQADVCLAVSDQDAAVIKKQVGTNVVVVPNGVSREQFPEPFPVRKQAETLLFIGNFSYIQNHDAVLRLLRFVLPHIRPTVTLLVVGRNASQQLREEVQRANAQTPHRVKLEDSFDDVRAVYAQADILVAPLFVGSGTKYKVLEAMMAGVPVVTSPGGIEGLAVNKERDVLIGESEEQLVKFTNRLLADDGLRRQLSRSAREQVEKKYTWERIGGKLEEAYELAKSKNNEQKDL